MGGNGVVNRFIASSLRLRAGMGLPVANTSSPTDPFPSTTSSYGTTTLFPKPCIARIADTVGKYEALARLCGGLSCFAGLGLLAVWNDKASKIPFAQKSTHMTIYE